MKINIIPGQETDWLIVFLILDVSDLKAPMLQLFAKVKDSKLKKTNKVYLLQDNIKRIKDPKTGFNNFSLSLTELRYDEDTATTQQFPIQLDEVNEKDGYAWREALQQICKIHEPRFSALFTWSHGAGIGIFNHFTQELAIQKNNFHLVRDFKERNKHFIINKFSCAEVQESNNALIIQNMPAGEECLALEDLFVSEIADGLNDMSREHLFDITFMCNCNTQIVDNCYNLNKVTRYYVAPITTINLEGFDFSGFINAINNELADDEMRDPYIKTLIRLFLDGYVTLSPGIERGVALIANDLQRILTLRTLLNGVCDYFIRHCTYVYPILADLLTDVNLPFSEKSYFDMVFLFDNIQIKLQCKEFNELYSTLRSLLVTGIRVDQHIGVQLNKSEFHCFSIYIPRKGGDTLDPVFCCQYFQEFAGSQFVKETLWDDFIRDFTLWRGKNKPPFIPATS